MKNKRRKREKNSNKGVSNEGLMLPIKTRSLNMTRSLDLIRVPATLPLSSAGEHTAHCPPFTLSGFGSRTDGPGAARDPPRRLAVAYLSHCAAGPAAARCSICRSPQRREAPACGLWRPRTGGPRAGCTCVLMPAAEPGARRGLPNRLRPSSPYP